MVGSDEGDEIDETHETKDDELRYVERYWRSDTRGIIVWIGQERFRFVGVAARVVVR